MSWHSYKNINNGMKYLVIIIWLTYIFGNL